MEADYTANIFGLGIVSVILLVTPLRYGRLRGYDDALYAHIAKDILKNRRLAEHSKQRAAGDGAPASAALDGSGAVPRFWSFRRRGQDSFRPSAATAQSSWFIGLRGDFFRIRSRQYWRC